jgi:hypothetical protein
MLDLGVPGQGNSLIVELFENTTPDTPCNPGIMTAFNVRLSGNRSR